MNIPLNIDWQQILLHLFNFVILFAILYFLLYKPVKDFMEKRTRYYIDMDQKAKLALENAKQKESEYTLQLNNIHEETENQKKQILSQANETAKKKIEQANAEAAVIVKKARAVAEAEKIKTLEAANREISDMVTSAAKKLVFRTDSEAFDRFLDSAERSGKDE